MHVGYRGYLGGQEYETEYLGPADDISDADGVAVIDWWQAVDKALKWRVELTSYVRSRIS